MRRIPDECPATQREIATVDTTRDPTNPSGWAALAQALSELRLFRDARAALKRFDTVVRHDPYLVFVQRGGYHGAIGELKHAERWYRKAAAVDPAALVFLGAVLARQGRLSEAKAAHQRATRAPHTDGLARDEAYFNWGLILRAQRRYRRACDCFDRAISLDPKYKIAIEANADVKAALSLDVPDDHSAHWLQMLDAMGNRPATCHELVRAYTRRYPRRFGGWVVLAKLLADLARYTEAVDALRKGVRLARTAEWKEFPEHFFHVQWGLLYEKRADFKRAEQSFRRAVRHRPSVSNLTDLTGVLIVQGRFAPAQALLQRAISIEADDPSHAHYQLGLIARARRQYAKALQYFDAALRYNRSFPLARDARRDVREAMNVAGDESP